MKTFTTAEYDKLLSLVATESIGQIKCIDHLNGFSITLDNAILDKVLCMSRELGHSIELHNSYVFGDRIKKKYPEIEFRHVFFAGMQAFRNYNVHPLRSNSKFLCSFNGSDHASRKLLVAALHRWRWFDPDSCSKNFQFTVDKLDGHLADYFDHATHRFHRPFFIGDDSAQFFDSIYSFGHVQYDHANNIYNLETQLTSSFLHIVSESIATSYYPLVTEKFLYSVVTRGLFLAYAPPGWHDHLQRYYGFRRYDKIFDYRFDAIQNPVERLVELMSLISKFSVLSSSDWRDLYEMESDTIEHNYDHYFSGRYLENLNQHAQ